MSRYYIGKAYWASGDREAARIEYGKAIELAPSPQEEYYLRMLIAADERNHFEVIEYAGEYLELGERGWVIFTRGTSYLALGQFDEAQADFERAVELMPNTAFIYVTRGHLYSRRGNLEQALADYNKAIELEPSAHLLRTRANFHKDHGNLEEALADYTSTIKLAPRRSYEYKRRGWLYFELGRYDEALADIAKAVELNPGDLSNLRWISPSQVATCSDERFRTGLLELADEVIELNDNAAGAYAARGWVLTSLGQEEKALVDLKTAFDGLADTDGLGRLSLSDTCEELGYLCGELAHRRDVIPYLVKLVELIPKDVVSTYRCALAQLGAIQPDSYRETCLAMLNQFQDTKKVADGYWTAWTCLLGPEAVDDYAPVVRLAEQAVEADPKSAGYLNTLGAILYRAGRADEAVERLTEAHDMIENPTAASTTSPAYNLYFLAMTHHRLEHDEEAQKWLDRANEWTDKVLGDDEPGAAALAWNRKLTLKLLREEAEKLLGKNTAVNSPGGATVNSQGREPLEAKPLEAKPNQPTEALKGR